MSIRNQGYYMLIGDWQGAGYSNPAIYVVDLAKLLRFCEEANLRIRPCTKAERKQWFPEGY